MKRFKSIILAVLMTLQILINTNVTVMAYNNSAENNVVTINEEHAKRDAEIHRTDEIELSEVELSNVEKPTKKEYEKNNIPNRLVTTFKGDTRTSRAFNWFASEDMESSVWISTEPDMSNATLFPATASKVVSHYVERNEDGYFLFQLLNKETKEIIRYFTDEGKEAGKWDYTFEISDRDKETVGIDIDKLKNTHIKPKQQD